MTQKNRNDNPMAEEINQYPPLAGQPDHPGWVTLARVLQQTDPFFENILFMMGYDFSSDIYVIKGGDGLTIVDPGNDYTAYMALFDLEYEPADIKKIVLTHGHRDHAMGTFELLRYPSINQRKEVEIVIHEDGPEEFKKMIKDAGFPLTEIKGGEKLDLGGTAWEVIFTPGHTMDGITLYNAEKRTAFTGDTVLPFGIADIDKNGGGRLDHLLYSAKELRKKDIAHILPGHGVPVASAGKRVIEVAYESVIAKILNAEGEVAWMDGAPALVQKGLLEEAAYCCDKHLEGHPEDMTALQLKAFCLTDMGRNEESLVLIDKILAQDTDNPHALLGKGHALLGLERYEESLTYFDRVLAIDADIKEAHIFKGMALYFLGRVDEAMDIEVFNREFAEKFKAQLTRAKSEGTSVQGRE